MAIFGSLLALLKADASQFKKGFAEADGALDKTRGKTKGLFADLKHQLGESSNLGQALKIGIGGGAVAAIGMLGDALANSAEKIRDFAKDMAAGKKSVIEVVDEVSRGLPV